MTKKNLCLLLAASSAFGLAASPLDGVRKAFVEASVADYSPDAQTTERFILYSDHGRANDVLLLQLYLSVHLPDGEVEALLDSYDWESGSWKDIDYEADDRGRWPATLHVTRMYSLAKLYKAGNERWKGSAELGRLLHLSMRWWFTNRPVCPNWWHNDIGVPKKMTAVLLMLRDELSQEEIDGGLKVLERSKFGRTGQNKAWLAGNNLMKGLLIDDEQLVIRARDYIAEEIFITQQEGIQEDWSFHQHGPQIQFGNYGLAYAEGMSFWLRVLKGTKYDFTPEQKEIVGNLISEGICRSVWKGVMDPSFCGRQNFIDAGPGKAFSLAVTALNMSEAVDSQSDFFRRIAAENLQPSVFSNTLVGAKYFNRSDCGIYRTPDWYASIRMHSERTVGFEFTNRENTLANFSADGALIMMISGKEFDNIFACWDWRKVPGVTAYDDGKPIKSDDSIQAKRNNSSHVGGLAGKNVMAATMELSRDGLHALKSAFFFDDCVVNLGAEISAENPGFKSVTTAVDQILLDGAVTEGENWIHHSSRGYVSLDGKPFRHTAGVQTGKWDYIEPSFKDRTDSKEIFRCWFDHPAAVSGAVQGDTYAYLMLPGKEARQTASVAKAVLKGGRKAPVKVLRNDGSCQAVVHGDVLCAVFHEKGLFELGSKAFSISGPSILILEGGQTLIVPLPALNKDCPAGNE